MANQFSIQPAQPLQGLGQVIGGGIEQQRQMQQQEAMRATLGTAAQMMESGDLAGYNRLITQNPQFREHLIASQGHASDQTKGARASAFKSALLANDKPSKILALTETANKIRSMGANTDEIDSFILEAESMTPAEIDQKMLFGLSTYDPAAAKAYMEARPESLSAKDKATARKLEAEAVLLEQKFEMLSGSNIPTEDKTKLEKELRQEVFNRSKDFETVDDAWARVQASIEDPSAAGDLALVFNFMKMLDPGSTVREGEFATAAESAGLSERMIASAKKLDSGERLSAKQRKDFSNRARKLYGVTKAKNDKLTSKYKSLSKRYGVDPANVILEASKPLSEMTMEELQALKAKGV